MSIVIKDGLDFINKNLNFTDVTSQIRFVKEIIPTNLTLSDNKINYLINMSNGFKITVDFFNSNNANLYIVGTSNNGEYIFHYTYPPYINTEVMNKNNYIYLAKKNKLNTEKIIDPNNTNIVITYNIYNIPYGEQFLREDGINLYEAELGIILYEYELGPKEVAKQTIINRFNASRKNNNPILLITIVILISIIIYLVIKCKFNNAIIN